MLHKTRGIVIKFIKYRDTSIIVNIFTETFGRQTYIVNSVRSKRSKGRIALYQPLTLLDMVVYHKEQSDIHRISEVKCSTPFMSLNSNIRKSSISLFLTEIIHKTIKEQQDVEDLFSFMHQSILILDVLEKNYQNFHLQFLLKLTQYLGISTAKIEDSELSLMLDKQQLSICSQLYQSPYDNVIHLDYNARQQLLLSLIDYYQRHIDNFGIVKSIEVLTEILKE